MVRIVLARPRMRSTLAFVVVLAAVWAGTGGRAFAAPNRVRGTPRERLAPAAVPELDPNAMGLALVLLGGGALIAVDRRRVRRS